MARRTGQCGSTSWSAWGLAPRSTGAGPDALVDVVLGVLSGSGLGALVGAGPNVLFLDGVKKRTRLAVRALIAG